MSRGMRALAAAAVAAGPVLAEAGEGRLWVSGSYATAKLEATENRTFTEFVEQGRLAVDSVFETGPGGEVGLEYRLKNGLGLHLAGSLANRDGDASFSADYPHPFYFGRPRRAEGAVSGLSSSETAFHFDLLWGRRSPGWEVALFAGLTLVNLEVDVIDLPRYTHAFPFDSVTIQTPTAASRSKSGTGFNAGLALDRRFGARFGVGVQARYSAATVEVPTPGEGQLELDAGGLSVSAGLRVYFGGK